MGQRVIFAALVAASTAAVASSADARAAGAARSSPTTAHAVLQTKLGRYKATITATNAAGGRRATLAVHLSRGNPARDEQTHTYAFTLPKRAVAIDSRLGKARIRARLGSFGRVDLRLAGRGKTSKEGSSPSCSGPGEISRAARARGRMNIRLGSLGALRAAGKSVRLDRATRRGTVRCAPPRCRRYAGTRVAGLNVGTGYLSVQSDGLGHTYVFGAVSERRASPPVSINHTRFALGGTITVNQGAGTDGRTIALSGSGPATGNLTFSGTGAEEADGGCRGHHVRRIFGPVTGQLALPIDGAGTIAVSGDGSASAPVGAYREQID
jgi:hypothetical protein